MSSITSNDRCRSNRSHSKLDDPKYVLSRYMYYKKTCCELKEENELTSQTLHDTKRALELKNLELRDATSELDAKEKEVQLLSTQLENMRISLNTLNKELDNKKDENCSLGNEIAALTLQVQEITLSKNLADMKMNSIQKNLYSPNVFKKMSIKKCESWWCPKHSELKIISKKITDKTLEEEKSITLALQRQRHWIRSGTVLCCVFDRKIGIDKHTVPPACILKYYQNVEHSQPGPSQQSVFSEHIISSSEDECSS